MPSAHEQLKNQLSIFQGLILDTCCRLPGSMPFTHPFVSQSNMQQKMQRLGVPVVPDSRAAAEDAEPHSDAAATQQSECDIWALACTCYGPCTSFFSAATVDCKSLASTAAKLDAPAVNQQVQQCNYLYTVSSNCVCPCWLHMFRPSAGFPTKTKFGNSLPFLNAMCHQLTCN